MSSESQRQIDFGAGEGSFDERRNLVGLSLLQVSTDLHLKDFVIWVFNVTKGGTAGELLKSYRELAASPWGLCCSESKARSTVARAVHYKLVNKSENRYVSCGQRANGYSIDWDGIRQLLRINRRPAVVSEHPPVLERQGDVLTKQGAVLREQPYKEIPLSSGFSSEDSLSRKPNPEEPTPREPWPRVFEIEEAEERKVLCLTVGELAYGVFKPLKEKFLAEPSCVVVWFRRQLSAERPVMGDSEAELLLTIAAAIHAVMMPAKEIKRSRCAVFIDVVAHHKWRRVTDRIPEARSRLDKVLSEQPNALICDDGVVPFLRSETWSSRRHTHPDVVAKADRESDRELRGQPS